MSETDFTQLKARYCGADDPHESSAKSFVVLGLVFASSCLLLYLVYLNFPSVDESDKQFITVPLNAEAAKHLGNVLVKYSNMNFYTVLFGYIIIYIFLQSFAIPGSIFLSCLSGFLYPFPLALFVVCLCSATGASCCYLLFHMVGKRLIWHYIPEKAVLVHQQVQKHRQHLFNYMIFVRIMPFIPNWLINVTAPVINIPLLTFYFGTFLGVAPASILTIQAGTTLQQLTSGSILSWTQLLSLSVLSFLALIPVIFKKNLQRKFD